jgi:hypothetical protein
MTNNKQQTAVSWFLDQLLKDGYIKRLPVLQLQQAKEMEKNHIIDAILDDKDITSQVIRAAEQYYKEKYGDNEQAIIDYNKMEEESEMDNYNEMKDEHEPETAVEWLREEITYDNGDGQRWGSFKETIDLTEYFEKAKEMELVHKEASYALGYSEGYKRSLEMVEWYIKHHIKGIE